VAVLVEPIAFANGAIYFFECAQIDPFSSVLGYLAITVTHRAIFPMPPPSASAQ